MGSSAQAEELALDESTENPPVVTEKEVEYVPLGWGKGGGSIF